jgi:uncharacterized protein YukE
MPDAPTFDHERRDESAHRYRPVDCRMGDNVAMTDHEHLRDAAATLRGRAAEAEAEIADLLRANPEDAGLWTGPTARTFYDVAEDVRRRTGAAATDLRDYASALDARADELDSQPSSDGTS